MDHQSKVDSRVGGLTQGCVRWDLRGAKEGNRPLGTKRGNPPKGGSKGIRGWPTEGGPEGSGRTKVTRGSGVAGEIPQRLGSVA